MSQRSLRRRLLRWLLLPLTPILAIGALLALHLASSAAQDAFDLSLLDAALDLARQVRVVDGRPSLDLPAAARQMLATSVDDRVIYSIRDDHGHHVSGEAALPIQMFSGSESRQAYYDAVVDGTPYRAIAMRSDLGDSHQHVDIAVAQTLKARDRIFAQTLAGLLLPELLLALAAVGTVWLGVRRGLVPAERLRGEIVARSPQDLRPIEEVSAPDELQPIVHAINELLSRLDTALGGQRQFIADAAHQLRTPLAVLRGRIELAIASPDQVTCGTLAELLAATERTTHLANQLLSLARAEHSRTAGETRDQVDLRALTAELAEEWVPRAAARDIELAFELSPAHVRGNSFLIREMLANLLDNAIRYTPTSGRVVIRTGTGRTAVGLDVEDNGPGIPPEFRDQVRDRFFRLADSTSGGCGLGLAIVDEIARAHDAQLALTAPSSGSGLRVHIAFPLPPTPTDGTTVPPP
jgi:two-component system sensor histidine kinase TctE